MDPLVTVEELASYLQRDPLDLATAELAVAGASGTVRGYCRWLVSRAEETFTVDGSGGVMLSLPTLHLVEVVEVRIYDTVIAPCDYASGVTASGQYSWSENGQLYRPDGWPRQFRAVQADVVHGYEPAPDVVRLIALSRAARYYNNPDRLASRTVGHMVRIYDLSDVECSQLDPYRLP